MNIAHKSTFVLSSRHLLGIEGLSHDDIVGLLDLSEEFVTLNRQIMRIIKQSIVRHRLENRIGLCVPMDPDFSETQPVAAFEDPKDYVELFMGLARRCVKEGADVRNEPGGSAGMAAVPGDLEDAVVEASEECPGECIFIEQG